MRLQEAILLALGATSALAVDIRLYANRKPSQNCGNKANWEQCSEIEERGCCHPKQDAYSVEGRNLVVDGVPAVLEVFTTGGCDKVCNSGGGSNTECVDCDDGYQIGGAKWSEFGGIEGQDVESGPRVHPDSVGIFDDRIEDFRIFSIGNEVPEDVVSQLREAVREGRTVGDLSDAITGFEIL